MQNGIQRYKNHRRKHYDYSSDGYYHIELNTKCRTHDFGEVVDDDDYKIQYSEAGRILEEEWFKTEKIRKEVTLGKFKIMPDHFHGIVQIGSPHLPEYILPYDQHLFVPFTPGFTNKFGPQYKTLSNLVGAFKGACTRRIKTFNQNFDWQVSFYDVIIRDMTQLRNLETYIENNIIEWKRENKGRKEM